MNKAKRSVSQRQNKKMRKEIKAAQRPLPPEPPLYSDKLTPTLLLKKYPKKVAKTEKAILEGAEKRWKAKKSRKVKKLSKRTTPGKVDAQSPPAHVHPEGSRWVKNVRDQNTAQRKGLQKKMTKRK